MLSKALIGIFIVAILGVIGFSILDASQTPVTSPLAGTAVPTQQNAAPVNSAVQQHGNAAPAQNLDVTAEPQQLQLATDNVGDVWQASGTITVLEDYGMTLSTESGEVYVELGPPEFWMAQNVSLAAGSYVTVDGFSNGDQIHARVVTLGTQQIVLRSEAGQPLWAGGADNVAGGSQFAAESTAQPGTGQTQFEVAPEDWVTITGTITATTNGGLTMLTDAGETLTLQLGRPDFWQSQDITLAAGDPVEILGFWSGTQFMVGDITKTVTGEHIILRDPNGRQLWGGPGRNGTSNGQSNGQGNGQGNGNGKNGSW